MTPNPPLGVTLHSIGGLAAASFYIPYKGVKGWAWEVFWIAGGFFSWIVAPWVLAMIIVPQTLDVLGGTTHNVLWWTFFFGVMWGVGGLTFGLTMRYLGIALGYAVALGCCAAFGTLIPPIYEGKFGEILSTTGGRVQLIGVGLCLVGIAISGVAGKLKESELTDEQKRATVSEFSFVKGMIVAVLCGIMSAAMAFGLAAGKPIETRALSLGVNPLWGGLPSLIVVFTGGFLTNFIWCAALQIKNGTFGQYFHARVPAKAKADQLSAAKDGAAIEYESSLRAPLIMNLLLCIAAGVTWYFQFFFYTMGASQMGRFGFASWSLHMASIIIFSTLWGISLHEWKGTSKKTHLVIAAGLAVLVASMIVVGWGTNLQAGS